MFLKHREQLERRARIGQLLRSDLELLKEIEDISVELQKATEDLKKLNNK